MRLPYGLLLTLLATPALAQPDLRIVGSVEETDQGRDPGEDVSLDYTVVNDGDVDVSSPTVGFYLSTDAALDASDVFLGSDSAGDVGAGEDEDDSEDVTIPSSTSDGQYYVLFVVDDGDVVAESDETNNVDAAALTVGDGGGGGTSGVELRLRGTFLPSGEVSPGGEVSADLNVYNGGSVTVDEVDVGFFISEDATWDAGDRFVDAESLGSNVEPGEMEEEDMDFDVPVDVEPGEYYFFLVVDPYDVFDEADEANNVLGKAVTVTGDPDATADLTIRRLRRDAYNVRAGTDVRLDYEVANLGGLGVDDGAVGIFLSADEVLSPDDRFFEVNGTFPIGGGEANQEAAFLTMPFNTPGGEYTLILVADYPDAVAESDESNNVATTRIRVLEKEPGAIGEVGAVTWDQYKLQAVGTLELASGFPDPVIVLGPHASDDDEPAVVVVHLFNRDRWVQAVEWDTQDGDEGDHGDTTVPYLVLEPGVYRLPDGRRVEAGLAETDARGFAAVSFSEPFDERPVVLATVRLRDTLLRDAVPVATQVRARPDRFRVDLAYAEGSTQAPPTQVVSWVAIAPGQGPVRGPLLTAGALRVGGTPTSVRFGRRVPADALLFGATQSLREADPAMPRLLDQDRWAATVVLQEETSADAETDHVEEQFGFAVFRPGVLYGERVEAPSVRAGAAASAEAPTLSVGIRPNPTAGPASVSVWVPTAGPVRVDVYDVVGRRVATIADGPAEAGALEVTLEGSRLPAGTYLVRATAGAEAATRQFVVVR